jgi:hypothetical protein
MAYFFCKFIPPRKDFLKTMSPDEAKLLKAHGEICKGCLSRERSWRTVRSLTPREDSACPCSTWTTKTNYLS